MPTLAVRQATEADVAAVGTVLLDGKAAIARLGIAQWQSEGYPSRADVAADVAQGVSYVAVNEAGQVVGTLSLLMNGEPMYDAIDGAWLTASTSAAPRYATVHRTAVAAGAARQGVMRTLVTEAEKIARAAGAESVRIDTHPGNTPMRGLAESLGYTSCGIVKLLREEPEPERVAYEKLLREEPEPERVAYEKLL